MLVWTFHPLRTGGAENQAQKLSRELISRGHTVTVLTRRHYSTRKTETVDGVAIRRMDAASSIADRLLEHLPPDMVDPRRRPAWLKLFPIRGIAGYWQKSLFMRHAEQFIRANKNVIDVIDVRMIDWLAGWAAMMGSKYHIPVTGAEATYPNSWSLSQPSIPHKAELTKCLYNLSIYIAKTPAMANDISAKGICPDRISIIPNGVDVPASTSDVENNTEVLFIGNLSQGSFKNFATIYAAWDQVLRVRPQASMTVVGGGAEPRELAKQRSALPQGSVTLAGYQSSLDQFFMKSALFLLPSRREGMSNALLEAMSYGIPSIVSDIPGNLALIKHEVNGLLVPSDDPSKLAQSILWLLDNPAQRKQFGLRARKTIEESFTIPIVASLWEEAYRASIDSTLETARSSCAE